jgi:hypothetical protein
MNVMSIAFPFPLLAQATPEASESWSLVLGIKQALWG